MEIHKSYRPLLEEAEVVEMMIGERGNQAFFCEAIKGSFRPKLDAKGYTHTTTTCH